MPHPWIASQKASLLLIYWGPDCSNHNANVQVMQSLAPQEGWHNAMMHTCCQAHLILPKNKHMSCYPTMISGGNCSAWSHCSTNYMLCKPACESIRKAVTHFGQPKKKQVCPRRSKLAQDRQTWRQSNACMCLATTWSWLAGLWNTFR